MPTYQYACTECQHRFEAVQSFTDDPLTECPQCTGRLRKVFNSVGIVFKGSGFYRTDSRGKPATDGEKPGDKSDKSDKKTEPATSGGNTGSAAPAAASSKTEAAPGKKESGSSTAGSAA